MKVGLVVPPPLHEAPFVLFWGDRGATVGEVLIELFEITEAVFLAFLLSDMGHSLFPLTPEVFRRSE